MDPIKEAFQRAKLDIDSLRYQLNLITQELQEIKRALQQMQDIERLTTSLHYRQTDKPTHPSITPTIQHITPTDILAHSNTPTDKLPLYGLKTQFSDISTGNKGVPTDRQTDRQTDQHKVSNLQIRSETTDNTPPRPRIQEVSKMLESLDGFKHELRRQFKSLTAQEMLVYTTIYQLEEEGNTVDYPLVAQKLRLSESSIRDYLLKISKKGVSITKIKQDNKKVTLSIPTELKKIVSLRALITLREL